MTTRDENSPQSGSNTPQDDSDQTTGEAAAESPTSEPQESQNSHSDPPAAGSDEPRADGAEAESDRGFSPPKIEFRSASSNADSATDSSASGVPAEADATAEDEVSPIQMEFSKAPTKTSDQSETEAPDTTSSEPQGPPPPRRQWPTHTGPAKGWPTPATPAKTQPAPPNQAPARPDPQPSPQPQPVPEPAPEPPTASSAEVEATPTSPSVTPAEPEATSPPDSEPSQAPAAEPAAQEPKRRSAIPVLASLGLVVIMVVALVGVWGFMHTQSPEQGSFRWQERAIPAEAAPVWANLSHEAPVPDPDLLEETLSPLLADPRMSGVLGFTVADALSGDVLLNLNGDEPLTPASSTKAVTTMAALAHLGPEYRIPTTVVAGEEEGTVVLIGGGDITLAVDDDEGFYPGAGTLSDLADQVLEALNGTEPSHLVYDLSLFTGDIQAPGTTNLDYAEGQTARMYPVMTNGGRSVFTPGDGSPTTRFDHPGEAAAEAFADLLGIEEIEEGTAAEGAEQLGVVHSAPMHRLLEHVMRMSDNVLADAVAFQVALATENEGSYPAVQRALTASLEDLGIDTAGLNIMDGSGLSRDTLISAEVFTRMLVLSIENPLFTPVLDTMPVAGYNGTLTNRFYTSPAVDAVGNAKAKTGALNEVSSLTGTVVTEEGRQLVFSLVLNERDWIFGAQEALDNVVGAMSGCGCS
ncbi:D-alanyl-D-alanine carboxypeptidase/D-alanyl-D-alanine endopeptidase [Natronoglycomyces albus]|uniref:D-alanyl-D-alanine carboxypeptidase/D-alanyl-D-alanine-endopeptidase n=1 Tax=Natronoglycomyces albus TaxID=2811108 RepID=A0A895XND4_9ACTN|nr:D-alanyl-D-alanine carboxypeptidase/D-alanyl-D-alanine-endopeptidase [Natronoglycomyces albus]QSB05053.1 D-alanyl-D-alanine carboxypeptidase/D-alanyl-D-alanine-endopeptidase [Natronoglycomyces albus]